MFVRDLEEAKQYQQALSPDAPDRFSFSADGAVYEFFRGEIPDFDAALDHLEAEGTGLLDPSGPHLFDVLYEKALATLQDQ